MTLKVKNNFGITNSQTTTVSSAESDSVSIEFDESLGFSCYMASDCFFSIKNITSCISSSSYNITWSLSQGSELSTDINSF